MTSVRNGIPLWWLALAATLTPLVTIHTTFAVSVLEGHVSWCIPYWDSCTSISRTGRYGTSYFIFKGTMLPAAILGILFWALNGRWLQQLGATSRGRPWVPWLGFVACTSLAAYTLALGHEGDGFNLIRRIGVVLYFSLTFIAQLLISSALKGHPRWHANGRRLLWLCELILAEGILSALLTAVVPGVYSQIDDALEWLSACFINLPATWVAVSRDQRNFQARQCAESSLG